MSLLNLSQIVSLLGSNPPKTSHLTQNKIQRHSIASKVMSLPTPASLITSLTPSPHPTVFLAISQTSQACSHFKALYVSLFLPGTLCTQISTEFTDTLGHIIGKSSLMNILWDDWKYYPNPFLFKLSYLSSWHITTWHYIIPWQIAPFFLTSQQLWSFNESST